MGLNWRIISPVGELLPPQNNCISGIIGTRCACVALQFEVLSLCSKTLQLKGSKLPSDTKSFRCCEDVPCLWSDVVVFVGFSSFAGNVCSVGGVPASHNHVFYTNSAVWVEFLYILYICVWTYFKYVTLGPILKHILNDYFYSSKKRERKNSYKNAILTSVGLTVMSCIEMHSIVSCANIAIQVGLENK